MKNYHTIQQGKADESNEVDALISRPIPADRSPSYKRYALVAVVALGFLLAYNLLGTAQVTFDMMHQLLDIVLDYSHDASFLTLIVLRFRISMHMATPMLLLFHRTTYRTMSMLSF